MSDNRLIRKLPAAQPRTTLARRTASYTASWRLLRALLLKELFAAVRSKTSRQSIAAPLEKVRALAAVSDKPRASTTHCYARRTVRATAQKTASPVDHLRVGCYGALKEHALPVCRHPMDYSKASLQAYRMCAVNRFYNNGARLPIACASKPA